jgi:hypothetical protein
MARKLTAKQLVKAREARIDRLYGQRCSGIQIPIMKIGEIFRAAEGEIANNPEIDDSTLGDKIHAFVQTIAV